MHIQHKKKTKNPVITYMKKSTTTKDKIHCVFQDAALVFETGGDWKSIFKHAKNKAQGNTRKMFELMQTSTTEQMDKFVNDLVKAHVPKTIEEATKAQTM